MTLEQSVRDAEASALFYSLEKRDEFYRATRNLFRGGWDFHRCRVTRRHGQGRVFYVIVGDVDRERLSFLEDFIFYRCFSPDQWDVKEPGWRPPPEEEAVTVRDNDAAELPVPLCQIDEHEFGYAGSSRECRCVKCGCLKGLERYMK